jgi:hypothetical protein
MADMRLVVWVIGGVFGLALLAVLVLSGMTMRPGAGQARAEVEIAASPAEVWPWLTGEKAKKWVSWLVEVREAGPDKQIWVMEDMNNGGQRMEIEATVLKSDFPRSMIVALVVPGGFTGQQAYTLTEVGGGRVKMAMEATFKMEAMLHRLMEPLITPAAEKKMGADLASLKAAVEKGSTAAVAR